MPTVERENLLLAVRNVARFGDTDVFPFPLENHWFHDAEDDVVGLLERIDSEFDDAVAKYPILSVKSLTGVGYSGFRAATQVDPIWNAYLLALLLQLGTDVENARVPRDRRIVFSYRFTPDDATARLFDKDLGWGAFHRAALEKAEGYNYVLSTDISDFYPRVYHHRLENALSQASHNKAAVTRVRALLFKLSSGTSYGLPVGGNAARLLAELLLNRVDRLVLARGVDFLRFVDDYFLFGNSREEVQKGLVLLSEALHTNEGLTLARSKTRLMSRAEFRRSSPLAKPEVAESEAESQARRFLKIRLSYDPYSPTADDDYDQLSEELEKFDILGMLAREFRKSRVDEVLVRQLVKSIKFLDKGLRERAVHSLVQNLGVLYPVFPTVAIVLRGVLDDLEAQAKELVFDRIRELVSSGSHIVLVPANMAFAVRLLAMDHAEETDALLISLYNQPGTDMMVKRDIILAMGRRRVEYWVSEALKRFSIVTPWEKRALLAVSYTLGDEGKYWRDGVKRELSEVERAYLRWVGDRNNGKLWELPL